MPSVKCVYTVEASSEALRLPQEEWINKVGDTDKVRHYNSCKYLTDFMLYDIRDP